MGMRTKKNAVGERYGFLGDSVGWFWGVENVWIEGF